MLGLSCLADPTPPVVLFALQEKFSKYIDFARSIMRALPPEEIPTDLADAHMFVKACDLFDGFYHQLGEEDLRDAMGALSGDSEAINLAKVMGRVGSSRAGASHKIQFDLATYVQSMQCLYM